MKSLFLFGISNILILFVVGVPRPVDDKKEDLIPLTVEVKNGTVKGAWMESVSQRKYAAFINIPYAKPPVGELRFQPPQPAEKWSGTIGGPLPENYHCVQLDESYWVDGMAVGGGTEDCLFLNVFSPLPKNASLPVLVYIHGGGFLKGNALNYDPNYLMDHDLVVVTFNYRLGIFGFLSTGDDIAPGNNGLKDQAMVLRWVQENVRAFGGDPDRVTIAGSDAGAASVHYHYMSDMSRGMFSRGIAMGASAFTPWAFSPKPKEKAKDLVAFLNCTDGSSQGIFKCINDTDAQLLAYCGLRANDWPVYAFSLFAPTIEAPATGAFLTQHPYEATRSGALYDAPLLASVTKDEGLKKTGLFPSGWYFQNDWSIIKSTWDVAIQKTLWFNDTLPEEQKANVGEQVKKQYFIEKKENKGDYKEFFQAVGDRLYVNSVGKMVEMFAAKSTSPVYLYKYSYLAEPTTAVDDEDCFFWGQCGASSKRDDVGVYHEDDLMHIFYLQHHSRSFEGDVVMSKILAKMVYRYCLGEAPNVSGEGPQWTPIAPEKPISYLDILSPTSFEMKTETDFGRRSFWDSLGFNEDQNYKKE